MTTRTLRRGPRTPFLPIAAVLGAVVAFSLGCPGPDDPVPPADAGLAPDAGEPADASPVVPDAALVDAGDPDAGEDVDASTPDAGQPDAGEADAGAPDAGGEPDGGPVVEPYPEWPPVFISAFGLSYDGPVADEGDVWVELTIAHADALAALGGWTYSSANHAYVNEQLASAELPWTLADGDVVRVHGSTFAGQTDTVRSDNNPGVWDMVSSEAFGPSFKHGLLWLQAADGRVLDAVIYETGNNQLGWLEDTALAAAQHAVDQGEWASTTPQDAVRVEDADREWARLSPTLHRAGNAASDWQVVGSTLETYYEDAVGKTGAELKAALHAIISGHVVVPYSEVSSAFSITDPDPANPSSILQFYTGRPTQSDFNKEHLWAKSHGGFDSDAYAGYSDLHHLRPTRPDVNSKRWHLDFDEGGTPYSDSGCNIVEGLSWEPRDEVKGEVARALFYMAVRYEGDDPPMPDLELVETIPSLLDAQGQPNNNQHTSTPRIGRLSTLLRWHVEDPPDDAERARNDVIFEQLQRNRNPFVDHPEWVHEIWGGPEWPVARSATH